MSKFKTATKTHLCIILCMLFVVSAFPFYGISAENKSASILTNGFVAESTAIRTTDERGDPVIILEHNEIKGCSRQIKTDNVKTTVAIFPENESVADAMMDSINNLTRGNGTHTEDEWFHGSSVHVTSTIYYNSKLINLFRFASITKVEVAIHCINGTTVPSMTILLGQVGIDENGVMQSNQRKEIYSTTPGTFYPPSSWVRINLDAGVSAPLVANVTFVAKRPAGQKTYTLYNAVY